MSWNKARWRAIGRAVAAMLLVVTSCGETRVSRYPAYLLISTDDRHDVIILFADGSMERSVRVLGGQYYRLVGRWEMVPNGVEVAYQQRRYEDGHFEAKAETEVLVGTWADGFRLVEPRGGAATRHLTRKVQVQRSERSVVESVGEDDP